MKEIVVWLGNQFIDIICLLCYAGAIVGGSMLMAGGKIWWGLFNIFAGIVIVTFAFYFIYLFISINDNLTSMNAKMTEKTPAKAKK